MEQAAAFIGYLKNEQPELWETIRKAADEGLIIIDEASDGVTATNRLLLTYPDLHTVLSFLVDNWTRRKTEVLARESAALLLKQVQGSHG